VRHCSLSKGGTQRHTADGVLSFLLWNSVVDDLIKRFERRAPKITTYADDIGIIITICDFRKFLKFYIFET